MRPPNRRLRTGPQAIAIAAFLGAFAVVGHIPRAGADVALPTNFVDDTLVTGLDLPTSMAFLPDGRLLITEQYTGKVRLIVNGHLAGTDPVFSVPFMNVGGYERGLEGIAVDPAFPTRPYVYVFYTVQGGTLRIERYTVTGDISDPSGESLAMSDPLILIGDIPDQQPVHQGGCLRFAPDGMLMVTLGEDDMPCLAQDSTTLHGAVLRLQVNALPAVGGPQVARSAITPPNNPLSTTDANAKLVWAYGFRNPFRMEIDPTNGNIFVADVGEATAEELDLVPGGANGGWPFREGNHVMTPACSEPGGVGASPYLAPIVSFDRGATNTVINLAGAYRPAVGGTANWPVAYHGDVFYGEFYEGVLMRLRRSGNAWVPGPQAPGQPDATHWATGMVSAVDFEVGPDGSLWWLSQSATHNYGEGIVHRIRWTGAPAPPPAPVVSPLKLTPMPFATATDIAFTLTAPAPVSLTIHDLSGRTVRRLLWSETPALDGTGTAHVSWDGTAGDGRHLPAGMYFARLEVGRAVHTARLVRIP